MAHQSNRVTPFTHGLIQTAKRNETHGMDAMSPKSLKVVPGRGERSVRKPHLFRDDVEQRVSPSFVSASFLFLFGRHIEPIKSLSLSSSLGVIRLRPCFDSQLLFSQRGHFSSFDFAVWKVAEKPFQSATLQFAGKAGSVIQKRAPRWGSRGHDDSCAVVDSLFGLAELSKSRI